MSDVKITAGPYEFLARWERGRCPKTVGAFERLLPYRQEILFPYYGTVFRSKLGELAANHLLTVTEGYENLRPLGELCLWEGAQDILFEKAEA